METEQRTKGDYEVEEKAAAVMDALCIADIDGDLKQTNRTQKKNALYTYESLYCDHRVLIHREESQRLFSVRFEGIDSSNVAGVVSAITERITERDNGDRSPWASENDLQLFLNEFKSREKDFFPQRFTSIRGGELLVFEQSKKAKERYRFSVKRLQPSQWCQLTERLITEVKNLSSRYVEEVNFTRFAADLQNAINARFCKIFSISTSSEDDKEAAEKQRESIRASQAGHQELNRLFLTMYSGLDSDTENVALKELDQLQGATAYPETLPQEDKLPSGTPRHSQKTSLLKDVIDRAYRLGFEELTESDLELLEQSVSVAIEKKKQLKVRERFNEACQAIDELKGIDNVTPKHLTKFFAKKHKAARLDLKRTEGEVLPDGKKRELVELIEAFQATGGTVKCKNKPCNASLDKTKSMQQHRFYVRGEADESGKRENLWSNIKVPLLTFLLK